MNPISIFSLATLMVVASAAPAPDWTLHSPVQNPISGNYNLGVDYTHNFDTSNRLTGSLLAATSPQFGLVPTAGLTYGNNDHSISYKHTETPLYSNQQFTGTANLYNDGTHKVNANGWWGNTQRHKRGFEWQNHGGNLEYIHKDGHSASVGTNLIPKFDIQTIDVTGKANLWQSDDKQSAFNAYGSASHNIGTNNYGHTDYHAGLNIEHSF